MELGKLVRKYREAHKLSQAELGRAVGVSQATIDKIESGKTTLSRFLPRIAARLGIPQQDLDPLIGAQRHQGPREPDAAADDHRRPAHEALFEAEDERTPDREDAQRRIRVWSARTERAETDLPVYIADADAFPIDWIKRPPPLANVRNAYGLLVKDSAMEPEFWPGDIALVHPHLPPSPQSACVFKPDSPPDAERSQLAHLISFDSAAWHVQQWHPPSGGVGKFTLSRKEWPVCHRVVGKYSRG